MRYTCENLTYDCSPEDTALPARPHRPPVWFLPHADGAYGVYQDDRSIILRFDDDLFAHLVLADGVVVHVAVGTRDALAAALPTGLVLA